MKKIEPIGPLVLVEVLEEPPISQKGIIMPENHLGRYIRYKVLAVGEEAHKKIRVGEIMIGNPTPKDEELEKGIKLINSKDLFAIEK